MAIISTATYKTLTGISGTSEDSKLDLMTAYVDSAIKKYCKRDFEETTYPGAATGGIGDSGYYSGNGTRDLVLRQRPVRPDTVTIYLDATGRWDQNPDGSFAAATLLVSGTDFAVDRDRYEGSEKVSMSGIVRRLNGTWPTLVGFRRGMISAEIYPAHSGNIKVSYTAGYATVPSDVVMAAGLWVSHLRNIQPKGGALNSESLGSYSYSMAAMQGGMPAEVRQILAAYKEIQV